MVGGFLHFGVILNCIQEALLYQTAWSATWQNINRPLESNGLKKDSNKMHNQHRPKDYIDLQTRKPIIKRHTPSSLPAHYPAHYNRGQKEEFVEWFQKKTSLKEAVYRHPETVDWNNHTIPLGDLFVRVPITPELNCRKYEFINQLFKRTSKKLQMVGLERVINPYIMGSYLLLRDELKSRYCSVDEIYCYHGTEIENRDKICAHNFDWRLFGDNYGHKFGQGVSFTPEAYYASHYSDKGDVIKIMFLVRVLVSQSVAGEKDMEIPPVLDHPDNLHRYDTSCKADGTVLVKYMDSEYVPEYIIYYTGEPYIPYYAAKKRSIAIAKKSVAHQQC